MYKIVSDSACDLSKEYLEKHDVTIVPLSVSFDEKHICRSDGTDCLLHRLFRQVRYWRKQQKQMGKIVEDDS